MRIQSHHFQTWPCCSPLPISFSSRSADGTGTPVHSSRRDQPTVGSGDLKDSRISAAYVTAERPTKAPAQALLAYLPHDPEIHRCANIRNATDVTEAADLPPLFPHLPHIQGSMAQFPVLDGR